MITDAGLDLIAKGLRDGSSIEITEIALGTDATAPAATDTSLGDEKFRKAVTQQLANGIGDTKTICYIAPYEATDFEIKEVGAFSADGTMIARWLYDRSKTDLESLQITRDDIFGRG